MKNFKHPTRGEEIDEIWEDHIIKCKFSQHPKELEIMERKLEGISNNISFRDYAQELIFKDAFIKGYIAAFVVSDEEQEILNSITPLGKALAED
jgi:hypothetical protein